MLGSDGTVPAVSIPDVTAAGAGIAAPEESTESGLRCIVPCRVKMKLGTVRPFHGALMPWVGSHNSANSPLLHLSARLK